MAFKRTLLSTHCLLALTAGSWSVVTLATLTDQPPIIMGAEDLTFSDIAITATGTVRGIEIYNPAHSAHGSITLSNSTVSAEQGDAIYLLDGDAILDNVGLLSEAGKGIDVNNYSNAKVSNSQITTHGTYGDGIWLAQADTTLSLSNSTITTDGAVAHALNAQYGKATFNDSVLSTSGSGSYGLHSENEVSGSGNTITTQGTSGIGVFAARGGVISLTNTTITTSGDSAAGLLAYPGSTINGDGLTVTTRGSDAAAGWVREGNLNLSNSQLSANGSGGIGLLVTSGISGIVSDITLDNTQVSSSGNVLQGNSNALAAVTASNGSVLTGNVRTDTTSRIALTLNRGSSLAGAVTGLDSFSIDGSSSWWLNGDSSLNQLNNNGTVTFSDATSGFNTLALSTLSGNGSFVMNSDIAALSADRIDVSGDISGSHLLSVKNSGAEPSAPDGIVTLVTSGGGAGVFRLAGGAVDAGAYSYGLQKSGNNWVLAAKTNSGGTLLPSPTAASALGLVNAIPTAWYSELSTLRSRLGEVREGNREGGAWVQTRGSKTRVDNQAGVAYQQNQQSVTLGVDSARAVESGQVINGLFSGISNSDLDFKGGSTGSINSFYLGAYSSWLHQDGWFTDSVLKLNNYNARANAVMSDGERSKGGFSVPALGLSFEAGRKLQLDDGWFVEPSAQLSTLWAKSDSFRFNNGLAARSGTARSQQVALHGVVGKSVTLSQGAQLTPWVRLSAIQELENNNRMTLNDQRFNNDLAGTRAEMTLGMSAQLQPDLQLYTEATTSKGRHISSPWNAAFGVRWSW
ncbi:autotransporter outer membrane beta-barrel domain-containing protein [Pantoea sp. BL1]|uniref:autotransporter outer membrane beta-barrel domain-containing protein n=1 Tax=Pantoea sp. BL1 TaxID=1628190 RepID=UPI0006981619|nr:autotransporter outer membrane beta-barrel domain-containing protein [Pantoea sp. BL1]